jgi:hypothetical protein
MANALRADAPTSVRGIVLFFAHPYHSGHWGADRAGPASTRCVASRYSSGWTTEPEFAAVFNEGMTSASNTEIEPVPAAYDISRFGAIVDVGGGHGRRVLLRIGAVGW